jgi:hypothetical protein
VSRGFDPFKDIHRAYGKAYSVSYADVEVNCDFGSVHSKLGRRLDLASHLMLVVSICTGEFA